MLKILKHFRHRTEIKIRFSDLDVAGHVNNSRYQSYLEEARIAYSQDVFNLSVTRTDFNSVISKISIEFIKPIEFGDTIAVYSRFSNFRDNLHEVHNLIIKENNGKQEIMCKAHTVMAAFDYSLKVPAVFPPQFAQMTEAYQGSTE